MAAAGLRQADARRRAMADPACRETKDSSQVTQAHRVVVVPHTFWTQWVPILGPVASCLYVQLRQYCYHNPATGETRSTCWPRQSTLAAAIGVKDVKTVRRALALLETHGFIAREAVYRIARPVQASASAPGVAGGARRGVDRISVRLEIPQPSTQSPPVIHTRAALDVDNSGHDGKSSLHTARENLPGRTSTRTSTSTNVTNVREQAPWEAEPARARRHPRRRADLPVRPEGCEAAGGRSAERESLALFVGDQLAAMSGTWDGEAHPSAGFHRRVAMRLDACLIHEALAATRDAMDDARGLPRGRGAPRPRPDPAAYFAGAIRRIAAREGIDLGVRWARDGPSSRASPGPASPWAPETRKEGTHG